VAGERMRPGRSPGRPSVAQGAGRAVDSLARAPPGLEKSARSSARPGHHFEAVVAPRPPPSVPRRQGSPSDPPVKPFSVDHQICDGSRRSRGSREAPSKRRKGRTRTPHLPSRRASHRRGGPQAPDRVVADPHRDARSSSARPMRLGTPGRFDRGETSTSRGGISSFASTNRFEHCHEPRCVPQEPHSVRPNLVTGELASRGRRYSASRVNLFKDDVEPWWQPRGLRDHRAAQRPERRYAAVIDSKDDAKAEKLLAKQRAPSALLPTAPTTACDARRRLRRAHDPPVVVATEGGLKAIVDSKFKDHLDQANGRPRSSRRWPRTARPRLPRRAGLRPQPSPTASSDPAGSARLCILPCGGAQDARRGPAGPARRPARRAVSICDAASLDARRAAARTSREASDDALLGWSSQPGPDARSRGRRPWPAAAGSPGVVVMRSWSISSIRRRLTCARRAGCDGRRRRVRRLDHQRRPRRRARHQDDRRAKIKRTAGRARSALAPRHRHEGHLAEGQLRIDDASRPRTRPVGPPRRPRRRCCFGWPSAGRTAVAGYHCAQPSGRLLAVLHRRRSSWATSFGPRSYSTSRMLRGWGGRISSRPSPAPDPDFQSQSYLDSFGRDRRRRQERGSGLTRSLFVATLL